jgi:hypothetical protein
MGDQYPSLPQGPSNLLVQVKVHPARPTAGAEAPGHWDPYLSDLLWWDVAHVYSQVRFERTGA